MNVIASIFAERGFRWEWQDPLLDPRLQITWPDLHRDVIENPSAWRRAARECAAGMEELARRVLDEQEDE